MADYIEIESATEIGRLNRLLAVKLRQALPVKRERTIGFPAGNFVGRVQFLSYTGPHVFWWEHHINEKGIASNYFGHGNPDSGMALNIDVQFNVPTRTFNRQTGGVFLRHRLTNSVVLAHRGIVTYHHGRVNKGALFAEMVVTIREAETTKGLKEVLLVGELESPGLVSDIDSFSVELRRTVQAISVPEKNDTIKATMKEETMAPTSLGPYFDEFEGEQKRRSRDQETIADCHHGAIVRALRDRLLNLGVEQISKSREIDLIATTSQSVFLFEVKTSLTPQAIYTAIGQLGMHSILAREHAKGRPIKRIIVLPGAPTKRFKTAFAIDLGIELMTFTQSKRGRITVDGSLDRILSL